MAAVQWWQASDGKAAPAAQLRKGGDDRAVTAGQRWQASDGQEATITQSRQGGSDERASAAAHQPQRCYGQREQLSDGGGGETSCSSIGDNNREH